MPTRFRCNRHNINSMNAATAYTKPTRFLHDAYTFPTQKLHFQGQKPRLQRRIYVCVNSLLLVSNIIL